MKDIRNYSSEEYGEFLLNQLVEINSLELVIIKGHILVEYTLNCYLESISNIEKSDFFKEKFTFSVKLNMASHFGQFSKKDNLYHGINLLNKLRNDIAHSLTYNDKHLEDYYSYIFNKNPELKDLNINKTEIEKFKISVAYLCGIVFAFYKYKTDKKDAKRFLKKIDKYRLTSRST